MSLSALRKLPFFIVALFIGLTEVTLAATRVALVSTCGGNAGEKVLALAEVKLSAEEKFALLERGEVERVLQEQKLLLCGISQGGQALTVGRLLGAEVFASLEAVPGGEEALGIVVFDASSGVRLGDTVLPAGTVVEVADSVVAAVRAACEKRQGAKTAVRTVCLLSVRNADLPRELDSLCESVGRLLERRLLRSASLSLLERQRLEEVNRERKLPARAPSPDVLTSLTIVELDIGRSSEGGGLRATASITDKAGQELAKVSAVVGQQNAVELADALLPRVLKTLDAAPVSASGDRARSPAVSTGGQVPRGKREPDRRPSLH